MGKIIVSKSGTLTWNGKTYRCAIGRDGTTENKKEGDWKTPIGCFPIREVFFREDKIKKPDTRLPIKSLKETDGWCDEPQDVNYNKFITLPYRASAENLWRDDHVYDIIVTLGYNDDPAIPGKGSAIFFHIARESYSGTGGCIAVSLPDMLEILSTIQNSTLVCVEK